MRNGEVNQQIHQFILKRFPLARKRNLGEADKLLESGIIDSMGILDLVAVLEKYFSITICDEELTPENFQSILAIAAFVRSKQIAAGQAAP